MDWENQLLENSRAYNSKERLIFRPSTRNHVNELPQQISYFWIRQMFPAVS